MNPTQAQIDAVRKAIEYYMPWDLRDRMEGPMSAMAMAAFTAAAGVGETDLEKENRLMNATIASSAIEIFELQKQVAATIERCAQVAEGYVKVCQALPNSVIDSVCRGIATAIRAIATDK